MKIQLTYLFNNLKKYYLKKDDVTNPHRKMVNVPGNQCFLLKQLVHSKPGEKQFQINLLQHHSRGYLDSNFQKFTKTTPLSWPQECRCLSHFPLAMWGTSSPYIQSCKQAKSCHFLWAKGGKELRDGMHRITYHLLCHYVLTSFLKAQTFQCSVHFFLARMWPKFDVCRRCLFSLPSSAFSPVFQICGSKRNLICITTFLFSALNSL